MRGLEKCGLPDFATNEISFDKKVLLKIPGREDWTGQTYIIGQMVQGGMIERVLIFNEKSGIYWERLSELSSRMIKIKIIEDDFDTLQLYAVILYWASGKCGVGREGSSIVLVKLESFCIGKCGQLRCEREPL